MPQKNPFGNDACEGGLNWVVGASRGVPALLAVHAEKSAGTPAAAPALSAVDRKWRRVSRKAWDGLLLDRLREHVER